MSWLGTTGIGRFADEILGRAPSNVELIPVRRDGKNVSVVAPLQLRSEIRRARANAFWSPGFMPPALSRELPQSITMHDLTHLHFYGATRRLYYQAVIKPLVNRMHTVFTVSEFSRHEIIEWSGLDSHRVLAVPHGLARTFVAEGAHFTLDRPYLLYVGNRRSYKNLHMLVDAFHRAGLASRGFVLALSGAPDDDLVQRARVLGIENDLRWLGHIDEHVLPSIYRGAHAVAFVSRYEGFGFPIIEAMGCGTPVVTSNVSSMPEVAAGAALLVDPADLESVSDGLLRVTEDTGLRSTLQALGLARARDFDWDVTAKTYWDRISDMADADGNARFSAVG